LLFSPFWWSDIFPNPLCQACQQAPGTPWIGFEKLILWLFAVENKLPKWVCLKIEKNPKPNGFADHYPY